MAIRILGVNIPDNKQIRIALTNIYGVGRSLSSEVLKEAKIDVFKKASELKQEEILKIKEIIESKVSVEGRLRKTVGMNIKRLKDIRCWRGIRHIKGLPVRGQTTRINSRTVRGNVRRTMSSGRKKAPSPK